MTVFEKLQSVTEAAQNEQELPNFLAERIYWIIENRDRFHAREADILELAEKVTNYDTYGQTGYLGMGVNNVILEKALSRLEE
ncbi:hypothetical protein FY034_00940 [Trichlorobacter lovleyi]|uniref:GSU3529 family protein n=1 Tax=Trichlorobacter lovleyi TaxID=313985 RepID=UPI0022407453|nr:hypothetical protein [Trichlorobacter lovleyi]QOX77565.1 hypothetical protein FY034_00940 [Trichlorobacter lovleyi]